MNVCIVLYNGSKEGRRVGGKEGDGWMDGWIEGKMVQLLEGGERGWER